MTEEKTYTIQNLNEVALWLIEKSKGKKLWLFIGEMGAGKTTLIKKIVEHFGFEVESNSPTFSIVNEYENNDKTIYHIDLFRLNSIEEAMEIGIESYLYSGNLCLIEWPQLILPLIEEEEVFKLNIEVVDSETRKIDISISLEKKVN